MKNFYIHSMGCKSNQFEGSIIKENLIKNGMIEVHNIEDADLYILNSCSVTHKSNNEAMYLIRNAKHKNPNLKTILTGCIAQIEKEKLLENEYIDIIVGNDDKLNIYNILNSQNKITVSDIMHQHDFNYAVLNNTTKTRVSLKIQDGCDNRCSYCIIPYARGKSRSAKPEFIIDQINNFANKNFKEVILTGIHIGQWGKDIDSNIVELIKEIEKTDIKRYRLGSLNPTEINEELLEILSNSNKFCPHFHLSLQSACNKTLKSMNRFYTVENYLKQIEQINSIFDMPFLGSDIITGFAGETEDDFKTTVSNLEKSGLSQIHTFPYSIREGTAGAKILNQLPEEVRQERAEIIKQISNKKYNEFVRKNIGTTREILIEKQNDKKTGFLKGITKNYLTVIINSNNNAQKNTIKQVKINDFNNGKIYGELV